ncbi:hypothetical protein N0V83_001225 [Neocucurbitaria cava]|uniref:LPXTG-domain-containing protein n=1 Tax=Neocucurbitaria cava TaxID=798079 RepID=A0A9W8YHG9_9PLEO|nr:hypothetical protein N0V83_001225 [Neocucurbitaria cava]
MVRSRSRPTTSGFLLLLVALSRSSALEVSPDSPCAPKCLDNPNGNVSDVDSSKTFNYNLACHDWEYMGDNSTQVGQKFKDCNNCLKSSEYIDTASDERDVEWFLFNNRGTVDWCLFGRFDNEKDKNITGSSIYKQCKNDCDAIYTSADYTIKKDPASYSFCDYDGNFTADADTCLSCLRKQDGLSILGNILETVQDLCKQKPGRVYDFPDNQEIYTTTPITLSATSSTSPSASPSPSPTPSSGLSTGGIVGIALAGVALVLGVILYFLRKRKNKNKSKQMAVAQGENGYGNLNTHGPGYGAPAGNYAYNPMAQSQKERYAHQPPIANVEQPGPAELGAQRPVTELPGGDVPGPIRH